MSTRPKKGYDFSGYATKNNVKCSDGRIILQDAFKHMDGKKVPLVFQHMHTDPENVLGHVILENRPDGVYCYGNFNNTPSGQNGRELVRHGDLDSLSIHANGLRQKGNEVLHGVIREVSLVLAGANPGAKIDNIQLLHTDGSSTIIDDEVIISSNELLHSIEEDGFPEDPIEDEVDIPEEQEVIDDVEEEVSEETETVDEDDKDSEEEQIEHAENDVVTIQDVIDSMSEDQQNVLYAVATAAANAAIVDAETSAQHSDNEGGEIMHNVFDNNNQQNNDQVLTHADFVSVLDDARKKSASSLKDVFLQHAEAKYGIENIDVLFPDARALDAAPTFISRDMDWVQGVLAGTRKTPFARIKTLTADITEEEARAKGYIKGDLKKEEFFKLSKRSTSATTVYKKQKLDRDDVIDITDFDVLAWLKAEMRVMLDEEIARAILFGDGRASDSTDKIKDPEGSVDGIGIRSILHDHVLYAHNADIPENLNPDEIIDAMLRSRVNYKGKGNPTLYTTNAFYLTLLLQKDGIGRRLYNNKSDLAAALNVKDIVTVEVMEGQKKDEKPLLGIVVNLSDYVIGADKGGAVSMFDDFDIDYNQMKYLIETRISGALAYPKSALVFLEGEAVVTEETDEPVEGEENE